jgi:hypothetical protein
MEAQQAPPSIAASADPMDRLGHLLIRAYNGDDLDPFFVHGHPAMVQTEDRIVRSCFYYSVVMTPKVTALFDNEGRGDMCTLELHELSGLWKTPDLLAALGVGFEELMDGTAAFEDRPLEAEEPTPAALCPNA